MPKFEGTDDRGEIKTTHKVNVGRTCSGVTKVTNTLKKGNKGNKLLVMVKICKRIKEKIQVAPVQFPFILQPLRYPI